MTIRITGAAMIVILAASTSATLAGPAADAVGHFYAEVGAELSEENRDRFTGMARAFLDANDRAWEENGEVCLDFGITVDAQDYDEDEIARTLTLTESVTGAAATVIAKFSLFGDPRSIEWSLLKEGESWKVADIAAPENGWRMSEFSCE